MARRGYYRELETLSTAKPPPTEVKCYTWRNFSEQQHSSTPPPRKGGRMAEATDGPQHVKTLQYTRRGLRMVGDPSLFDLVEPVWHPDEKVSHWR